MADVDFGDLLDYLAGDTKSRAILLYMEAVTHAPKFLSAARRAARVQAGDRHQGGAARRRGARQPPRTPARLAAPMPPTMRRFAARAVARQRRSTSCSRPPRCWRAHPQLDRRAAGDPDQRRRRRRARRRSSGRRAAAPGRAVGRDARSARRGSCRRPGPAAIRSTSSAMPGRSAMRRRSSRCWRIPAATPCWRSTARPRWPPAPRSPERVAIDVSRERRSQQAAGHQLARRRRSGGGARSCSRANGIANVRDTRRCRRAASCSSCAMPAPRTS